MFQCSETASGDRKLTERSMKLDKSHLSERRRDGFEKATGEIINIQQKFEIIIDFFLRFLLQINLTDVWNEYIYIYVFFS